MTLISSLETLSGNCSLSGICQIVWPISKPSGTGLDLSISTTGTASSPYPGGLRLTLQHETVVRYMAQFDALPAAYGVHSVQVDPESGEILIFYETRDERPLYVIERWYGCEFRGSSDWVAAEG